MNKIEARSLEELLSCVLARFSDLLLMNEREVTEFTNLFLPVNEGDFNTKDYGSSYNELYSLLSMNKEQFEDYLYTHKVRVLAPDADLLSSENMVQVNDGYPVSEEISKVDGDDVANSQLLESEIAPIYETAMANNEILEEKVEDLEYNNQDLIQENLMQAEITNVDNSMELSTDSQQLEQTYNGKQKSLGTKPISKQSGFTSILLLSFLTGIFSGITFMVIWLISSNV